MATKSSLLMLRCFHTNCCFNELRLSRHHRESEILNKEYTKALEILKGE
jgi:hypothetical protein